VKSKSFRDTITQSGFDHLKFGVSALILMLMSHKFGANVSNLILIPKKTNNEGYYNFIFS
jgi:hypothetical protein